MYDSKIDYAEKALEIQIDYKALLEPIREEFHDFLDSDSGCNGVYASPQFKALSVKIELLAKLRQRGFTCLVEIPDIRRMVEGTHLSEEELEDICRELLYNIIEDSMLNVRSKIDHFLKIIGKSESVSSEEGKQRMKKLVRDAVNEIRLKLRENNQLEWI